MSAHKCIDKICVIVIAITLILTVLFCNGQAFGIATAARTIGYENRLFDPSKVHTLDIVIDDWDGFLETCEREVYSSCTVIIDGEAIKNVGIRGKGNTSLSSVRNMDSSRYSFKIEFDQYDSTKSYHGLDKLCLNNIIQDNTYMKDYISYTLMYGFGADAPLCSYTYITVNGEDWGLYLAVEAIEESFLERNYGSNFGDLYKPDSMSFGGGPGNGKDFNMDDFVNQNSQDVENPKDIAEGAQQQRPERRRPDIGSFDPNQTPEFGNGKIYRFDPNNMPENFAPSEMFGGDKGGFGRGSDDVKLKYTDDEISSYSNIFNHAKTTVTAADQKRLIAALKALSEQTDLERTLDTDEVLRYFVVHNFLCNGDSYTGQMIHNYYLYEKDGQLSMIPWDYNLAFGTFMGSNASSSVNSPIDTPVSGDMSDRPMVSWIFDHAQYTDQYHQLFTEFLDSVDLDTMLSETAALISPYVEKDPTRFCTYEAFQKGVTAMRSYCLLRTESVRGQLDGTIPATSEGQSSDKSALIDTGDLNISDMGSMHNGGKSDRFGQKWDSAQFTQTPETESSQINGASLRPFYSGNSIAMQTAARNFNGEPPQGFGGDMPPDFDPNNMPPDFNPNDMPQNFDPNHMPQENIEPQPDAAPDGQSPDQADDGGIRPNAFPSMNEAASQNHITAYILLAVSALILLIGLIFAIRFRR